MPGGEIFDRKCSIHMFILSFLFLFLFHYFPFCSFLPDSPYLIKKVLILLLRFILFSATLSDMLIVFVRSNALVAVLANN